MVVGVVIGSLGALLVFLFAPIAVGTRPLTEEELAIAKPIFETSLEYKKIRINNGGPLTWIYPALTTGNTISFPENFNGSTGKAHALFLHEMTHVWQYQNHGIGYLPRALFEEITQRDAYTVHYDVSKRFLDYDIEEQAEIVAEYFLTKNESYVPYMTELRSARSF